MQSLGGFSNFSHAPSGSQRHPLAGLHVRPGGAATDIPGARQWVVKQPSKMLRFCHHWDMQKHLLALPWQLGWLLPMQELNMGVSEKKPMTVGASSWLNTG